MGTPWRTFKALKGQPVFIPTYRGIGPGISADWPFNLRVLALKSGGICPLLVGIGPVICEYRPCNLWVLALILLVLAQMTWRVFFEYYIR